MIGDLVTCLILAIISLAWFFDSLPYYLPLTFLALYALAIVIREQNQNCRTDMLNQLKSSRSELRNGASIVHQNMLLRYDSILTSYYFSVGGLVTNVNIQSPYFIKGKNDHYQALIYSLYSMLFGWWSIPHGPTFTWSALIKNFKGGEEVTVAQLIDRNLFNDSQINFSLLQRMRQRVEEQRKEKEEQQIQINTGEGSRSAKQLEKIPQQSKGKTIEERLDEIYNPKSFGEKLSHQMRAEIRVQANKSAKGVLKMVDKLKLIIIQKKNKGK